MTSPRPVSGTRPDGLVRPAPRRRILWGLTLIVALLHLVLLLGLTHSLDLSLTRSTSTAPLQTRMIAPAQPTAVAPRPVKRPTPRPTSPSSPSPAEPLPEPPVASTDATTVNSPAEPVVQPPEEVVGSAPADAASSPVPAQTWPMISLGALPPSSLLSYRMTGMDKGLTYHASGELRWQHNPRLYALTLSVRAFLVGSRQWRSVGHIGADGLAPVRFSDSWRNERATHFDRDKQRIVFSSNAPEVPLLPGAQDQVSLYVQLAAAMAGEPERYQGGHRLQVQTATVRDALPWLLVHEGQESVDIAGQSVLTTKWICQPRSRYDAKVELWVSAQHAWLPARIRITQASGSYIDLVLRGMEPLPALPADAPLGEKTTGS